VLAALSALREQARRGATVQEIKQEIDRKYPFLKKISPYLPKNALELGTYLLFITTLVSPYIASKFERPVQNMHVEEFASNCEGLRNIALHPANPSVEMPPVVTVMRRRR
jgi:hypothetical protein